MGLILYDLCGRDPDLRFSPYCWRIKAALAQKGLEATTVPTTFTGIAAIEGGVSKSVPVLKDGDEIVSDSFAIARYLDRAYPDRPALFGSDQAVAAYRLIETWANTMVHRVIMRIMVKDIHDALDEADKPYFRASREARLGRSLEEHQTGAEANETALNAAMGPVRVTLGEYDWLGGPEPRFADHIVFGSLMWLGTITGSLPLATDDPVIGWFERCKARIPAQ